MDFNATIDLIIKDLNEASKIIDDLKKYQGVPALQVELAKAKCRSAGEVIALLKNTEDKNEVIVSPITDSASVEQIIEKDENIYDSFVIDNEEVGRETENEVKEEVTDELTNEVKEEVITELTEVLKEEVKYTVIEKGPVASDKSKDSEIIADRFSHLSSRINEQLGNQKDEDDVLEVIRKKPITKLEDAIGINDRYLFIREIFDNNKDTYRQAISQLDKADNLKDARTIIMSYTGENKESRAVKQLINLVKRKLPSDE